MGRQASSSFQPAKLGEQYRGLLKTRDFQEGRDAEAQKRAPVYEGMLIAGGMMPIFM